MRLLAVKPEHAANKGCSDVAVSARACIMLVNKNRATRPRAPWRCMRVKHGGTGDGRPSVGAGVARTSASPYETVAPTGRLTSLFGPWCHQASVHRRYSIVGILCVCLGVRLKEGRLLPSRWECGQAEVHILIQLLVAGSQSTCRQSLMFVGSSA